MKTESKSQQTAPTNGNDKPNFRAIRRALDAAKQSGLLPREHDQFAMRLIVTTLKVPPHCARGQCRRTGLCLGRDVQCYHKQFRESLQPIYVREFLPLIQRMVEEQGGEEPAPPYDDGRRKYPPEKNKNAGTSPATTAKGGSA